MSDPYLILPRTENQACGIAHYARDFLAGRWPLPDQAVLERLLWFHTDSVGCAVAALAEGCLAPRILQAEAWEYPDPRGAVCFGDRRRVKPEKAVVASVAAVRELDANGTNFGYNPRTGACRGEFGHNDFYPVVMAAVGRAGCHGQKALLAMLCLDEIRGRLAEVFALRDHKIDHVLHGAIAAAAVYGALRGASVEAIESAIGMVVAHYVPFRAIRHGHQLSDSKGASAALSAEAAVLSVERAIRGFRGPADIFRNPQALFCLFEPPPRPGESPFDLELATHGSDFAIMGMHFKLGLYEHQAAGAMAGLIRLLLKVPALAEDPDAIQELRVLLYEPALSIIADPHKRDPRTRQSADHSLVYILATLLLKAHQATQRGDWPHDEVAAWQSWMLLPEDYDEAALHEPRKRQLMQRIHFSHGGSEYDARYPDGLPASVEIVHRDRGRHTSGLVLYPPGHARCREPRLYDLLRAKFDRLAGRGVADPAALRQRLHQLPHLTPDETSELYSFPLKSGRSEGPNGLEPEHSP
jgi:2-methylcitrate dehydratase